jgi:hypothetical protein
MSFPLNTNTKLEAGAAILGATFAAAGAILIEPMLMVLGAAAVTAATVMRVRESRERQGKKIEDSFSSDAIIALTSDNHPGTVKK